MPNISKKEYNDYIVYCQDKRNGRILTADSIRLICESEQSNPEAVGKRILESYSKFIAEGVYEMRKEDD